MTFRTAVTGHCISDSCARQTQWFFILLQSVKQVMTSSVLQCTTVKISTHNLMTISNVQTNLHMTCVLRIVRETIICERLYVLTPLSPNNKNVSFGKIGRRVTNHYLFICQVYFEKYCLILTPPWFEVVQHRSVTATTISRVKNKTQGKAYTTWHKYLSKVQWSLMSRPTGA